MRKIFQLKPLFEIYGLLKDILQTMHFVNSEIAFLPYI